MRSAATYSRTMRPVVAVASLTLLAAACTTGLEDTTAEGAQDEPAAVDTDAGDAGATDDGGADGASGDDRGAEVAIDDVTDLNIAYFSAGSSNAYLQAAIDEAETVAEELGIGLDVFDGEFDAQVQFDQIQTALESGRYNAFAAEPNDGNLVCEILTEDAADAGILVSVFNLPICGRAAELGEDTWQPGTITYVGGQTLDVYELWVEQVIEAHPDGATVALISGPDLNANTIVFFEAAQAFEDAEGFEVVARQTTDYTTPQAADAAQDILQANPDLDVIMSNFSGMTRGVVGVAEGRDVDVYDFGGDQWALDAVDSGQLAGTVIMLPRQETRDAIEAIADHVTGADVPRFINLIESETLPGTPFVTPDTVDDFDAEY